MNDAEYKHTVTLVFEVDAIHWEAAAEKVLRTGLQHLADCRVRRKYGGQIHINPASLARALEQLRSATPPPEGE